MLQEEIGKNKLETGLTPRWTDKLFLDNDGNIMDFNNNKLGYKVINCDKCMLCGKDRDTKGGAE